jgi:hypothetical protein
MEELASILVAGILIAFAKRFIYKVEANAKREDSKEVGKERL